MIRERQPGRYQVVVYAGVDPTTGRERYLRRTVRGRPGAKRPAAATRVEAALKAEARATRAHGPGRTFRALLEAWLEHAAPNLATKTREGYRGSMDRWLLPHLGAQPLSTLTSGALDAFYAELSTQLAPKTIHNLHIVIRRALRQACAWGWLEVNPASYATPPSAPPPDIQPPSPADVAATLEWCQAHYPALGVIVRLAATTGARRGELCALQWADYSPTEGTLLISRSVATTLQGLELKGTKTGRARRLALGATSRAHLDEHLRVGTPPWVFPSPQSPAKPWHPDSVSAAYRRAQAGAGVPPTRFHDLRHYSATQALSAGEPVNVVAGRLGHRKASTTLDVYAHWLPANDLSAANTLDETLAIDLPPSGN